ncbi:MAG TPA: FAD-binding protein [Acidobacteriota bacterium]|nr:FAD-binding protein [Acidobacteriota bacterium]
MSHTLVIAEHDQGTLKTASLAAAAAAQKAGAPFDILLLGSGLGATAEALRGAGAAAVLVADHADLAQPLADRYAAVIAAVSTFAKDVLPRAAALVDAAMVSDVIGLENSSGALTFRRVMFAGNVIATVQLEGDVQFATVRSAAFSASAPTDAQSPVEAITVDPAKLPRFATFENREVKKSARPDATEARIIVSGGRAIKNAEDFERLVGGLADTLGAAVGSSRALVDAGITPNSLQIGQTGKIVAPELYLAVGISGAIQHMAGMKDTKIIAAINKDAEAPIFEVADYGLVADVYDAVPELIQKLKK